jgi:hypothetical protein
VVGVIHSDSGTTSAASPAAMSFAATNPQPRPPTLASTSSTRVLETSTPLASSQRHSASKSAGVRASRAVAAVADAAGSTAKRARPLREAGPRDAVGTPRRAIGIVRGDAAVAAVAAESDMGGRRCASVRVGNANQVSRCRVRWCACD